jgi:peptide/nickel transport system substrate-binding protein
MAHAIDREALVEITQRGHAMVGNPGFVPPDSPWHNPEVLSYDYDRERARRLLQEAGCQIQSDGIFQDGSPLRLQLLSQPRFKDVGLFVKGQLEGIGIQIDLQGLEPKTLDSKVLHWQFQLALSGHGGLYEPSFLKRWVLDEGFNSVRYHRNEDLTGLILAQMEEMDPVKRRQIVRAYYGLDGYTPHTLVELGKEWGCTKQAVHYHLRRALHRLRHPAFSAPLRTLLDLNRRQDYLQALRPGGRGS